jgi:hypothetical protein
MKPDLFYSSSHPSHSRLDPTRRKKTLVLLLVAIHPSVATSSKQREEDLTAGLCGSSRFDGAVASFPAWGSSEHSATNVGALSRRSSTRASTSTGRSGHRRRNGRTAAGERRDQKQTWEEIAAYSKRRCDAVDNNLARFRRGDEKTHRRPHIRKLTVKINGNTDFILSEIWLFRVGV